jgi:O-antigen biosynthesis protein
MHRPPVSVVVPSLGRPAELVRCLTALGQLTYRPHEVVVVACEAGRSAIARQADRPWLRVVPNSGTGIAAARNDGIGAAAGAIVAFIDDDAVPEPTWLHHLVAAMEETGAPAATGFVRGRNGISFQWRDRTIRRDGFIDTRGDSGVAPRIPPHGSGIVMLEGTNMAFRRDVLAGLGGFDPAFRFYMDDADISVRLSDAGHAAAVAPLAQVHHSFAPSVRRRRDRMPTYLHDNGRSLAIFLRAHGAEGMPQLLAAHREGERRRLIRCMVAGLAEPRDVRRLLASFDEGVRDGMVAAFGAARAVAVPPAGAEFRDEEVSHAPRILSGRSWSRRRLRAEAAGAAARGDAVMKRKVTKAIFPVAGLGTRFLPATKSIPKEIMTLVDRPLIQYAIDEARAAGIKEFIFVTSRGKSALEDYFDHAPELESRAARANKDELLETLKARTWIRAPSPISASTARSGLAMPCGARTAWSATSPSR